jgi:hypothetical protein
LVPWAWGTNGYASVVSAVAAGLLAMEMGFSGVMGLGVLTYLLATLLLPASAAAPSPCPTTPTAETNTQA